MKQINYTGSSKLISRIVSLLNRKAPLPLDGNGDPDWGTNGQVLMTDGSGSTSWGAGGGGGDTVTWTQDQLSGTKIAEIDINGTTTNVYAPTPTAQVQADWTEADNTQADYIKNKPNLATVATSGSYTDLSDKPTIPSVGGHTIEKSDGTDMTARALLQFIGAYLQDDAGNNRTIANIVRTMTQAQFNALSAAEKEGFIYISDAAGQLTASEVALAAIAGMSATTVQSGVAELNTSINSLITSVNAKTPYVNLGGQGGIEDAWDALAIYDQPVIGRFTRNGYWWFIGLKYTGGQYGMMLAQPYYSTTLYSLSVSGGTKTVGTIGARTVTTLVDESVNVAIGGSKSYSTLTYNALSAYDEVHVMIVFFTYHVITATLTKAQLYKCYNSSMSLYMGDKTDTAQVTITAGSTTISDLSSSSDYISRILIEGIKYN